MSDRPKPPNAGKGRVKGVPNKATQTVRDVFALFVENNAGNVQELFDRVAEDNPDRALDLLTRFSEFVVPKLSRATIDGEIGVRGTLLISD
jgi:hypothetical protein